MFKTYVISAVSHSSLSPWGVGVGGGGYIHVLEATRDRRPDTQTDDFINLKRK